MTGREPGHAAFEPAPLTTRRRRLDPVVLGAFVVVLAIGVAVLKPWAPAVPDPVARGSQPAGSGASGDAMTSPPDPVVAASGGPRISTPPIPWSAAAAAVVPRGEWGVRAIVRERQTAPRQPDDPAGTGLVERWAPAIESEGSGAPSSLASPGTADQGVLALGLTFPPDELPLDARVMRATDAGWEWLDTTPLGASPAIGAFLYGPPRIDGIVRATWPTGAYRIEVLAASGIRHIDVELPDRFEVVPAPAFVPDEMRTGLASPFAPDLGALGRRGLFVVQGGLAVAVPVRPGTALEPAAAWKDTPRVPGGDDTDRVAAIHAPRANGLGYIFEPDATDATAELVRILPADPLVDARLGIGARFDGNDRFPYVILRAPGGLPWGPGIYRMDLAWTDATGPRWASVHMDFRAGQIGPAPTVLGSMRRVAPAAGRDMVAGVAGPEGLPLDLACTGERTGESIVSTDPPVVMGLGHPVGAPPTDVRAERVSDAVAVEQPLLTAREVIPGLTLLAPADGDTFVPGVYRLTVVTEGETRRLTVCAGVTDLD